MEEIMGIIITKVSLSKQTVSTKEVFKLSVAVKETAPEPTAYRLPVVLGTNKGGIK